MRTNQTGMSLIELMITVAIVAVLASIAIPSYRHYVIRANRADAKAGLLAAASELERCFTRFNSYRAADGCAVALPRASPDRQYRIEADPGPDPAAPAPGVTVSSFALRAVPLGAQAQDERCAMFQLNSRNQKTVSTGAAECWAR